MASWQSYLMEMMMRGRRQLIAKPKSPAEARRRFDSMLLSAKFGARYRTERIAAHGVPAERVEAASLAAARGGERRVLFLHGGGYVAGSLNGYRPFVGALSETLSAPVVAPDYRLAPEHPFPAAVEDAVLAYEWALQQAPAARWVVVGDSAGGGLALATLLKAKEEGMAMPGGVVLFSPLVDLTFSGDSFRRARIDPMLTAEVLRQCADWYVRPEQRQNPFASPLYADLGGLPPTLLLVGNRELLADDATRLAERLRGAGVDVTYELWRGMGHVWPLYGDFLPEAAQALRRVAEWVSETVVSGAVANSREQ